MNKFWKQYINDSINHVKNNSNPNCLVVVSGQTHDQDYWRNHFKITAPDILGSIDKTRILSIREPRRKGNFLGILNAWSEIQKDLKRKSNEFPDVLIMSMVFGKGKRLSPFTQTLGGRKSAFPTPYLGSSGNYLNTADLSILYSNLIVEQLSKSGFRGVLVKWGDEIIIPGSDINVKKNLSHTDIIRFSGWSDLSPEILQEKEWFVIDKNNNDIIKHYPRQPLDIITNRFSQFGRSEFDLKINLGSVALSYEFLDCALKEFQDDVISPEKWLDCDPYVWVALLCKNDKEWENERLYERDHGAKGIKELEERYPDFYQRIKKLQEKLTIIRKNPPKIWSFDFEHMLWADFGLHLSLRKNLSAMIDDSDIGYAFRDIFGLDHHRDNNGNIILRSNIPEGCDIKNSIIIDTTITDIKSVVNRGIVVGGKHHALHMPFGGAVLFSATNWLTLKGPNCIVLRFIGEGFILEEGSRLTTVWEVSNGQSFLSNEQVKNYNDSNYTEPVGNTLSFNELEKIVTNGNFVSDDIWKQKWAAWK